MLVASFSDCIAEGAVEGLLLFREQVFNVNVDFILVGVVEQHVGIFTYNLQKENLEKN